ncbi:MAG: hypothetical protein BMS9Abin36_0798 [Gammaproteobacteria bacterium]|nr:MAG: hypothetical protein BMS9Abin36_0798 [Gammaproteobacteria bacterium]
MSKQNADLIFRKVFAGQVNLDLSKPLMECTWDELHANRKQVLRASNDLVKAGKDLSDEENTAFTVGLDVVDAIDTELDGRYKTGQRGARTPLGQSYNPATQSYGSFGNDITPSSGSLRAFKGPNAKQDAYRSGQWLLAHLHGDEKAIRWCTDNGLPVAAAGGAINTKGGFLVPDEISTAIISLQEEYGVFRRECRVLPMSSDTLTIPRRDGGLTAYFVGENVEGTESDQSWGNVELNAKKLMVLTRMSSELNDDAIISMADDLTDQIAYAFANKEDDCAFNGDGTSTYGGITGIRTAIIDGTHTAGAVDAATGIDTFAEVTATDLSNVMAALPQYALPNAKWFVSQAGYSLVFERLMQAAGGNSLIILGGKAQMSYLGYPIVVSQSMPTSTGDLSNVSMLLFGDLRKAATMGARREVRVMVSAHRYMELDQIGVMGTERFDVVTHDLGDNTTAGPIVSLIGE